MPSRFAQEWFYHDGKDLVFVVGKERKKYTKADLPVFLAHFADHGDLAINPDELDKYGFIGYIPNTNIMDAPFDYGKMFIVKDKLCDGTQWHERILPAHPAFDPYFAIDQATLALRPQENGIHVQFLTLTPNFDHYELRTDAGEWKPSGDDFSWSIHPGSNRLQARAINQFGISGPISTAEIELSK